MTTKNKINLYISSKHYAKNNDLEVILPTGLIKCHEKDEFIVLNVNGWVMKNEFYNTQNSNNQYQITVSNNDDTGAIIHSKTISIGNYNVIEFLAILKTQLSGLLNISYDSNLNKYVFVNDILTNKKIKLQSISANDFIGIDNNVSYTINTGESFTSVNQINMAGDEMITLSIPNISRKYPVLDNFKNGSMNTSDVIAYLSINVPPFALMEYKNQDGGDSFSYRLSNTVIDTLHLLCHNQDSQIINVGEYQLNLQFEIHKKVTEYDILKRIERLVSNIFQWMGKDE